MNGLFEIVHEDADLLIINKPAGLVCHPTKGDEYSSLISRVRLYLGASGSIHLVNRLDRETSGLVVVAKTDSMAAALRRLWEAGQVEKTYLALVGGTVETAAGVIESPIGPDPESAVVIKGRVCDGGAPSRTEYERLEVLSRAGKTYTWLRVTPRTGRKHQIRIHLASIGHPIIGDKIYGPDERLYLAFVEGRMTVEQEKLLELANQALHAATLSWTMNGRDWKFSAELRPEMRLFKDGSP